MGSLYRCEVQLRGYAPDLVSAVPHRRCRSRGGSRNSRGSVGLERAAKRMNRPVGAANTAERTVSPLAHTDFSSVDVPEIPEALLDLLVALDTRCLADLDGRQSLVERRQEVVPVVACGVGNRLALAGVSL
jgi:hypothetical protein